MIIVVDFVCKSNLWLHDSSLHVVVALSLGSSWSQCG